MMLEQKCTHRSIGFGQRRLELAWSILGNSLFFKPIDAASAKPLCVKPPHAIDHVMRVLPKSLDASTYHQRGGLQTPYLSDTEAQLHSTALQITS